MNHWRVLPARVNFVDRAVIRGGPPVLAAGTSKMTGSQYAGIKALDIAAEKAGTEVFVYDATNFTLVNGAPFRSIRMAAKSLPISARTLALKLDTGKPFKGYYFYSHAQSRGQ
jgi:hypothetical protein